MYSSHSTKINYHFLDQLSTYRFWLTWFSSSLTFKAMIFPLSDKLLLLMLVSPWRICSNSLWFMIHPVLCIDTHSPQVIETPVIMVNKSPQKTRLSLYSITITDYQWATSDKEAQRVASTVKSIGCHVDKLSVSIPQHTTWLVMTSLLVHTYAVFLM